MGKITEYIDFLKRPPKELTHDFIISNYTHIEITEELKSLRRELRWYKEDIDADLLLF